MRRAVPDIGKFIKSVPKAISLIDTITDIGYSCNIERDGAAMTRAVYVDGVNKGEVFKKAGRWFWRRGEIAVEPFAKGSTLDDVADWARKCCNGKCAEVKCESHAK